MNTCCTPHLEMCSKRFTMATVTLFSACEKTHRALVVCGPELVTSFLRSTFTITTKVAAALLLNCYMAGAT